MPRLNEETVKQLRTHLFSQAPDDLCQVHRLLQETTDVWQGRQLVKLNVRQKKRVAEYLDAVWLSQFPAPFFSGGPREEQQRYVQATLRLCLRQ
jgi:hypothetical protein